MKDTSNVRDEIEFATNWNRPFEIIFRKIKWLNSFAKLNEVFALMIFNEFKKGMF